MTATERTMQDNRGSRKLACFGHTKVSTVDLRQQGWLLVDGHKLGGLGSLVFFSLPLIMDFSFLTAP